MKKLLTTLLCVTMVICMMPTMAFAEEGSDPAQAGETVPVENSQEETPAAEPDNVTTLSGESATAENLAKALTGAESGTVIALEIGESGLTYSDSLSVPDGVTLEVKSGKLTLEKTTTLGNKGAAIQIDKGAEVEATTLTVGDSRGYDEASLSVAGSLIINSGLIVSGKGTVTVSGTVTCKGSVIRNIGTISIESSGKVKGETGANVTNLGTLTVGAGGSLKLQSSLNNGTTRAGKIINYGTISAEQYKGGSVKGTNTRAGDVENHGTFSVNKDLDQDTIAFEQVVGTFLNAGTLNVGLEEETSTTTTATMKIGSAGVVECTSDATLYVKTKLENAGSVTLPEGCTIPEGSTNSGTVIVLGEDARYPFDNTDEVVAEVSNAGRAGFSFNLASALAGAANGDVVKILQDCTITSSTTATSSDATLDLNGKTLTMGNGITIASGAKLTVTDSSTGKKGVVNGYFADVIGELIVQNGAFGYTDGAAAAYNFCVNGGKLKVEGGTFRAEKGLAKYNGGEIVIADENFAFVNTDREDFDHLPIACYDSNGSTCTISLPTGKQISRTANENGIYSFTLTNAQAVASVDGKSYTSLQAAFDAAASGSVVTLLRDTIATEVTYVPAGKEIVLDMSGHEYVGLNLVTISPLENSTLTVKDTSGKNAVLGGTYPISIGRVTTGGAKANNAAVTLESGANIVAKRTLTSNTVGVAVESRGTGTNATVTVKEGAQVSGIRAGVELSVENGVINMESGTVRSNSTDRSGCGAVMVGPNGELNVSGGSIAGYSKAIVTGANANANIADGTVCGQIYLTGKDSSLNIENGTFTALVSDGYYHDKSLIDGGTNAKITIDGGTFKNVTDEGKKTYANELIQLGDNNVLTINGGTFLSNRCELIDVAETAKVVINDGSLTATNADVIHIGLLQAEKKADITINGGAFTGSYENTAEEGESQSAAADSVFCIDKLNKGAYTINITDGLFEVSKNQTIYKAEGTAAEGSQTTISGGVFEQVLYSSTAAFKPKFTIEAGLFKTEPESDDLAEDKTTSEVTLDGEDYTSVGNATAGVAQVGENAFYTDIDTAITAANAAGEDEEATLIILDDVALDENTPEVDSDVKVKVADGVVIDNNSGNKLTVTNSNGKEVTVPAGAVLDGNGNVVAGTKDQRPQVNPDGTVTVPAGGTITRPDGKVTEVPAESQVNTAVAYTIIFQDGKASETKVLYAGMALPTPTKSGYTFGGWFTDEACTIAFDIAKAKAGEEYPLYAKWTANSTGYYPATSTAQKPVIETTEGAAAVLDSTGTTATITVADGYELVDVTVNGISKGKVTTLTGLKTGDKVVVTAQKITNADDIAAQIAAVKSVKLVARSQMSKAQGKKAVKITWYATDGSEAELDGVEIFRSTKRYSGYGKKPIFTTTKAQYHNTAVRTGAKYYYKVRGYKVIAGEKVYTDWSTKAWRTVK